MSLSAIADQYKSEQDKLDKAATRQLATIFPALNLKDLDRTAPGWVFSAERITADHYKKSQELAADVYSDVRREAGEFTRVSFVLPPMNGEKLRASLLFTGPSTGKKMMSRGARIPDVARTLFSQTTAASLRIGANGGRRMISATAKRDSATPGRHGYLRVPGPKPCGFCAMVAMQVYNSEETAGADFHDWDKCVAIPRIRDAIPDGYKDRMREFEDIYVENRAMRRNRYGREVVDAKQTIRNMNRAMRERYGA